MANENYTTIKHLEGVTGGPPYSVGVIAGGLVFLSGQRPVDSETGVIPPTFEEQVNAVFGNVKRALEEAESDLKRVVKVTVYLTDLGRFDEFNRLYAELFAKPYPARTTVQTILRDIQIEVDVIAASHT